MYFLSIHARIILFIDFALIVYFERRAILRPGLAVVVDPCRGDVRVAEPFLHLGDIGLMIQRVGGGGGS